MAKTLRVTAPLPSTIKHLTVDGIWKWNDPGIRYSEDVVVSYSRLTASEVAVATHASWTTYYNILISWPACPTAHFPVRVSYYVRSDSGSIRSEQSEKYELGTKPKYDVYLRHCVEEPSSGSGKAGPWLYQGTTDLTSYGNTVYPIDGSYDYVQFLVAGPVEDRNNYLLYDASGDMTGMWTGSGDDYGPAGEYQVKSTDTHVIGLTSPIPKGTA